MLDLIYYFFATAPVPVLYLAVCATFIVGVAVVYRPILMILEALNPEFLTSPTSYREQI